MYCIYNRRAYNKGSLLNMANGGGLQKKSWKKNLLITVPYKKKCFK